MDICDNYPCTNPIDDNSVTRIIELKTAPTDGKPSRLMRNYAVHFCSSECAEEYYNRPTPINLAPTRDADPLRERLTARQSAVDVEYATRLAIARAAANRELEPLEMKALREEAELEVPWIDGASGMFRGADTNLVAIWRNGRGDVIESHQAETPDAINSWWKGEDEVGN